MATNFEMRVFRKDVLPDAESIVPGGFYLLRNTETGELSFATTTLGDTANPLKSITSDDVLDLIRDNTSSAAEKLTNPVNVSFEDDGRVTSDVLGSFQFDGSEETPVLAALELANIHGTAPGRVTVVNVDAKGRVVGTDVLEIADLPDNIPASKIEFIPGQDLNVNAATATKLKTAVNINGKSFDGSADVNLVPSDIGAAPLVDGLVPTEYLPLSVDNVVEVSAFDQLPGRPDADPALGPPLLGTLYVVVTNPNEDPDHSSKVYRWSGSTYIQILDGVSLSDQTMSLYESRKIQIGGAGSDATWEVMFKGNADVIGAMTLNNTGVTAGDYGFINVDAKGRLTAARLLQKSDIPELDHTVVKSAASIMVENPAW